MYSVRSHLALVHSGSEYVSWCNWIWFPSNWFIDCKQPGPYSWQVLHLLMKDSQTDNKNIFFLAPSLSICYPIGLQAELANYRLTEFISSEPGVIAGLIIGLIGRWHCCRSPSSNLMLWTFEIVQIISANLKVPCFSLWICLFVNCLYCCTITLPNPQWDTQKKQVEIPERNLHLLSVLLPAQVLVQAFFSWPAIKYVYVISPMRNVLLKVLCQNVDRQ